MSWREFHDVQEVQEVQEVQVKIIHPRVGMNSDGQKLNRKSEFRRARVSSP